MSKRISKMLFSKERVELALIDDLNRAKNSVLADMSIIDEAKKITNRLYSTLVREIPNARERVDTNESIYKSALKKYQSALDKQLTFRKAAKELGIEATSNSDYNKLVDELMNYKKDIEDIRKVNDLLEKLLK